MPATDGLTKGRTFLGHVAAGTIVGAVLGAVHFVLEPVMGFAGRWEYLGAGMANVFEVYFVFGMLMGMAAGVVAGALAALAGRLKNPDAYVPFYLAGAAFFAIFAYSVRHHSMARFKAVATSGEGVVFLIVLAALIGIAFGITRLLRKRPLFGRMSRGSVTGLVFLCFLIAGANHILAGRQQWRLPDKSVDIENFDGPNVVFVLLDALRADHLSCYGYPRDTTPNIDRLAREGVRFSNAHSHGNRTIISMPSLFTSLYPSFHGAVGRGKYMRPLPDDRTTITELFERKGYTTVALMNNVYLKNKFNLTQGFDCLEEFYAERYNLGLYKLLRHAGIIERPRFAVNVHPDADEMMDVAVEWLDRLEGRPYYFYVHLMDTHHPYAPPPPYDTLYGKTENVPAPMELFKTTTQLLRSDALSELRDIELEKLIDYYDGTIRIADDQIGRLVEKALEVSGDRETIVVITADHGDEFMEHGSLYHNNLVIEELIHIPLVMWSSARFEKGRTVDCLVRHADVLPTLADIIDAPVPQEAVGQSLVPLLEGKLDRIDVESISEGDFCAALNEGDWKIMRVDTTDSFHLMDLTLEPREKADLSKTHPAKFEQLHARLSEYLAEAKRIRKAMEAEADEDTIRELKALGYI